MSFVAAEGLMPPMLILPSSGTYNPASSRRMVLFPNPDGPVITSFAPASKRAL